MAYLQILFEWSPHHSRVRPGEQPGLPDPAPREAIDVLHGIKASSPGLELTTRHPAPEQIMLNVVWFVPAE